MISKYNYSLDSDLALAQSLADTATKISLSYYRKKVSTQTKDNGTPVTEVDLEIEQTLRSILKRERPEDAILGEEFGEAPGSNRRWLIDPIDGTSEFIVGNDHWGNHIALEQDNELRLGVLTRPSLNRRWWATKNGGAFHASATHLKDYKAVQLSTTEQLSQSKVTIWEQVPTKRVKALKEMGIWIQPSLSNIVELLDGQIDAYIDVLGKPWDHAPIALIVSEAGGTFRDKLGGNRIDLGEICYSNGQLGSVLFNVLQSC